jgi:hypothetical protein
MVTNQVVARANIATANEMQELRREGALASTSSEVDGEHLIC